MEFLVVIPVLVFAVWGFRVMRYAFNKTDQRLDDVCK